MPSLRAQLVTDGASATLANVTNVLAGTLTVGTNGPFTALKFSADSLVTNSAHGVIGRNPTAHSNHVELLGPRARWAMGGGLFVGSNGAFNRLIVSGGGFLNNNNGTLGQRASAGTNIALVTGIGSLWTNRGELIVGQAAPGNQLAVSNGAHVFSVIGTIGNQPGSSNNQVVVTGNGSVWTNQLSVNVGGGERGNRLTVAAGGTVEGDSGNLGSVFGGQGEALVTGIGSRWSSRKDLAVGLNGSESVLVVSNGAAVTAGNNGRIGVVTGSTNNAVIVTGAGSLWSNQFDLYVGEGGPRNQLEVNSGGWAVSSNTYVGFGGASNVALVTGVGSTLSNRADMVIGQSSGNNQMQVSGGANVFIGGQAMIGRDGNAASNSVLVADPGTRWRVTGNLTVGSNTPFNRLVVSNGAFVANSISLIGDQAMASNNAVLVTGTGSVWSNALVGVGNFGGGNQLTVSNGGFVSSHLGGSLGKGPSSSHNLVLVSGAGSVWDATGNLFIGFLSPANQLTVENAGHVYNDLGIIGEGSDRNEVLVTGAGSLWSNRVSMTVGDVGFGNRLTLSQGGTAYGSNVIVGFAPNSTNNEVVVAGGSLRASSPAGTSFLDVRRGSVSLESGLVDVDHLVLTNQGNLNSVYGQEDTTRISFNTIRQITNTVAGLPGRVNHLTVTLSNFTCNAPVLLDVLLVGPGGQKVLLMSNAGESGAMNQARLDFDDGATALLPESGDIVSGRYLPTDYPPTLFIGSPAPPGPYSTNLAAFNGSDPNGMWFLFIRNGAPVSVVSAQLAGWSLTIQTDVPLSGPGTFVFNGGTLVTRGADLRNNGPFVVGGSGGVPAVWEARAGLNDTVVESDLLVGNKSSFNQLIIPSGIVVAGSNVVVGADPATANNNLLRVTGGTLRVLNPGTSLDIRGGTHRLDAGLVDVSRLVVTNTRGQVELNGGTLRTSSTTIANGRVFTVGGGANPATLQLLHGTHTFANNLTIVTNGSLIGTPTIDGTVTVSPGGQLTPGSPIGPMGVLGSVILQGAVNLQIDKSGGVRTSDAVTAEGAIFYGGTLNVTDIGADVLSAGDRFRLFTATPYIGAFATLNLPPLASGLSWRNNLSVDGSIEVAAMPQPGFASLTLNGTNLVLAGTNGPANGSYTVLASTNVTLPLSNWSPLATRQFDGQGSFNFTNALAPGIPQRFFQLRTP